DEDEDESATLQLARLPGAAVPASASHADAVPHGAGRPLSSGERAFFEPRYGFDFTSVRVHSGAEASEKAASFGARAYTLGRDIVVGDAQPDLATNEGTRLLAHELTHVVPQSGGPGGPIM